MFDWVSDFFSESMWVFDRTLLYFIYWIEQVFNILAGLRQIPSSSTNTKDLLYNFLKDDSLTKVFSVMLLIGLGMFVICLMWGTIKATFFNKNSKDSFKKVLLSSFKALIYMVFIPVFVFCGIWIFSQLLTIISNAFQIQLTGSATSQITSGMSDAEITDIYQKSSISCCF